ncbi:uncharacterized protein LOC134827891 [Culicoides brevitarsis]|uniref:uncharacterized protein LOC134827891 n=1 Tax=Culicoides brevitarsis TaxID=469753 RepID=UPI00307BF5D4
MQAARMFIRNSVNFTARRGYKSKHHRTVTMNDMPQPHGDFFELEAARNRYYNSVLFSGLAVFGASLAFAANSGLMELHYSPPKTLD